MVPEENLLLMLSRNLLSHHFLFVLRLRVNYLCVFERFISCIVHLWLVFELMFLPVKLYTVKINFFVYCEFICKLSLFKIHFPADVWYRKLVHVLNQL